MNETIYQQTKNAVRGRTPLVAAFVLGSLFGTVTKRQHKESRPHPPRSSLRHRQETRLSCRPEGR